MADPCTLGKSAVDSFPVLACSDYKPENALTPGLIGSINRII